MRLEVQIERGGSGVTPKGLKTRSVPARSALCQLFVGLVVRVNSSACGKVKWQKLSLSFSVSGLFLNWCRRQDFTGGVGGGGGG